MKFEYPFVVWAIALLVPLSIALYIYGRRRGRVQLAGIIAPRLRDGLVRSVDFARRRMKAILFTAGLCVLLIALARPQFGQTPLETERSSVDFLIALDLSRSMLAEDMEGKARLLAAKAGISKLLEQLHGDRVGLLGFAGEAFLAAPITEDHAAVQRNLDALDITSIAKPGSDIAAAIKLAQKTFENGEHESKALVVITDGEELQGDAVVAARAAALKGMSVFAVGVGTSAGARLPARKEDNVKFAKNEFGREVVSRLNERALQQVGASGRGFYEPLGKEGAGLISVWRRGLEPLAKGTKTKFSKDLREYFQWPLAIAIALLFAEMHLNDRRKRPTESRA